MLHPEIQATLNRIHYPNESMRYKIVFVVAFSVVYTACSQISPLINRSDFSSYAEDVFRRQNSATSLIMMAAADLEDDEALLKAELNMHDSCRLLNEYSEKEARGQTISVLFKKRVQNSIADCETRVIAVEQLLQNFQ